VSTRWTRPARIAATLAGGALAIWIGYRLSPGDRQLFTLMGLYAIVAVGLSLLMGFAGQISLGQGAFYAVGAYTAGILTLGLDPDERLLPESGIDPWLAVVCAPLVTAAIAALIGVPLLRLRGHYLAFATLALHLILLAFLFAQDRFTGGQDPGLGVLEPLEIFGWEVTSVLGASPRLTALVWGAVALTLVVASNLVASRAGRGLQAIATSERMAAASGVSVSAYKLRLFVLSAGLAGLAGGLFTFQLQFLSPDAFDVFLSIQFVVMVAIGGLGSVYGPVLGAIAIVWIEDELRELGTRESLLGRDLPDQAPQVFSVGVYAVILIVVILFFPRGLFPALADWVRRVTRRRNASPPAPPAPDAADAAA
jgi:branched-chain amino acid transport system permease protein